MKEFGAGSYERSNHGVWQIVELSRHKSQKLAEIAAKKYARKSASKTGWWSESGKVPVKVV